MTKIVAFAGRKQSGKTTSAEFLEKYFNETIKPIDGAKIYNFADSLKQDICMSILGLTYDQCYGEDIHKNTLTSIRWRDMPEYNISWTYRTDYDVSGFMTARQVMQKIGTNIFRRIKHDVWSSALINKIKRESPKLAIIADCRFPNEAQAVKQGDGIVIKLTRNPYNSDHESETALDKINYADHNFNLVVYNENISISEQNQVILKFLIGKGVIS